MDYNKALLMEQAILDIKKGINIEGNIILIEDAVVNIIENEKLKRAKLEKTVTFPFDEYYPLKELARAIHAFSNGRATYKQAIDEMRRYEEETQDILHAMELSDDLPDDKLTSLAKDLQEVRQTRRRAKDFTEQMKPFYDFLEANQGALRELGQVQAEMMRKQQHMAIRTYRPRRKTEMEIRFESLQQKKNRKES